MFASKENMKLIDRLKKRSDFLRVQREGRKWVSKGMIVEICSNDGLGLRCGLTVSKKVSKLSVLRNRFKRRLKSISYDVLPAYKNNNLDIVIVGRVASDERSYESLKTDLAWCLNKMGVLAVGEKI